MSNTNSKIVFQKGRQLFLIGLVLPLDLVFDSLLNYIPRNQYWYYAASIMALLSLTIVWQLAKTRMVTGILDLCLYDFLAQLFGLTMYVMQWNPAAPDPLPYHVIVYSITLAKVFYMTWPLNESEDLPILGPISYWYWGKAGDLQLAFAKKICIYLTLVALPIATYVLFVLFESNPPFVRGFIAVAWFALNWDFLRQHQMLQESYEDALDEKKQLFERLEELEREYPSAVANDSQFNAVEEQELIAVYQQSSPESRTLAMKLLQASKFRRQQELAAKAKDQRLTTAQETGSGVLRPGTQ